MILGGHDIIEKYTAAEIWLISHGWAPIEIVTFNVNWATQEVPFPQFGLRLKEGQSAEEFMDEVEKKVNTMIGESTMNKYKAYKNLVKHKRRIIQVFSEVCGEKSFRSRRPGVPVKVPAVAVASCSAAPLKAPREDLRRKEKETRMRHPLPQFVLRRQDLLNQVNGSKNHLKSFQMSNFKRLPTSLS
jgi:hypothetical protein